MSAQRPLDGRVAVVTGSSRGIGRAMALRLAREGASVVITGKSEAGSEKLPGSIHTVVAEVEAAGGSALAVRVDVRHEEEVKAMVDATVERFGRLDVLINNAGALWWQPILDTPPKRYDLMWEINVRAAYLCAYYALPHMVEQHWGHLINCSPPISTTPSPGHVAYMTTKMGMTRLAIGIAAEHAADGIASNSLWPVTIIESLASVNFGLGTPVLWRKPDILVDSVLKLVAKEPGEITGRALIDEDFLRGEGMTDFDGYACVPGTKPPRLSWNMHA